MGVFSASFRYWWKINLRYTGWIIFSLISPIVFSIIPILFGWAIAGSPVNAEISFKRVVGTGNYYLYMILGSGFMLLTSAAMWDFGSWIREQQEMGTLEQILLTPANMLEILLGIVFAELTMFTGLFIVSVIIGSAIFGVLDYILNPKFIIALAFMLLGMLPMTGFGLVIGGLIIKIKEPWAIIRLLNPILFFLMGAFYPITLFPFFLRMIAICIPATIALQDVRAILLDISFVFDPLVDTLLLTVYLVIWPTLGLLAFERFEESAKKEGTVGGY